jgi:hypothetical protein
MTSRFARELSVWADFNGFDESYRIRTSLRFAREWPSQGEWVWLHDGEGNAVFGIVEAVDGLAARVRAEMSTWTSAADIPINAPAPSAMPFRAPFPQAEPAKAR